VSAVVDVPVVDADRRETGEVVQVLWPPPQHLVRPGEPALELDEVETLERFGCGCIRGRRRVYVAARP
jgi:hypothetical protein